MSESLSILTSTTVAPALVNVGDQACSFLESVPASWTMDILLSGMHLALSAELLGVIITRPTYLALVSVTASLASKIFSTDQAADVSIAIFLVLEQVIKFFKVHLADTAPFVLLILVILEVLFLGKATSTIPIGAWELAIILG